MVAGKRRDSLSTTIPTGMDSTSPRSNPNLLDFIERKLVAGAVVKLGGGVLGINRTKNRLKLLAAL